MLAGVAAGIGSYLGVDAMFVRIALVVLTFFGGIGVLAYLACWLLVPEEGRQASIADEFVGSVREWQD
jgi:phage shock protein PspC (stress-responsive transcriptional regulator)